MHLAVKDCWGKDKDHFSSHGKFLSKKKSLHRAETAEDEGDYNIIVTGAGFFPPLLELKGRIRIGGGRNVYISRSRLSCRFPPF